MRPVSQSSCGLNQESGMRILMLPCRKNTKKESLVFLISIFLTTSAALENRKIQKNNKKSPAINAGLFYFICQIMAKRFFLRLNHKCLVHVDKRLTFHPAEGYQTPCRTRVRH